MKTTKEEADERIHENLVENLQALLEKNYDSEKGFKKALTNVEHLDLKEFLKYQAALRNRFATELDKEIHLLNEHPKEKGSSAGNFHRTWMDIKSALGGNSDNAILEECIRGDKRSIDEYEERLKNNRFPPKIKDLLEKQLTAFKYTVSKVNRLEDLAGDWK